MSPASHSSSESFSRTFQVAWGDLDANGHMANTAYLDRCADVRMMFFAEHGFPMREFERLRFGPVIRRDEVEYFREMRLLESMRVTLAVAGLSADGARFRMPTSSTERLASSRLASRAKAAGWIKRRASSRRRPSSLRPACSRLPS